MRDPQTYAHRDTASTPLLRDAIKHSSRKRRKCASTDVDYDPSAKARYDKNYDEIFGKKEMKHGRD